MFVRFEFFEAKLPFSNIILFYYMKRSRKTSTVHKTATITTQNTERTHENFSLFVLVKY